MWLAALPSESTRLLAAKGLSQDAKSAHTSLRTNTDNVLRIRQVLARQNLDAAAMLLHSHLFWCGDPLLTLLYLVAEGNMHMLQVRPYGACEGVLNNTGPAQHTLTMSKIQYRATAWHRSFRRNSIQPRCSAEAPDTLWRWRMYTVHRK